MIDPATINWKFDDEIVTDAPLPDMELDKCWDIACPTLTSKKEKHKMSIGNNLKKLRLNNKLTQMQLSQKLGIGQTTIAAYENGVHIPQISSLIAYANYFNCSLDYLVGRN